jgi:amidase
MTLKESYDIAGYPTTWGHPALKNQKVATNALATQRLLDAGATVFGKTNVPLNLADWQSYNEVYGTPAIPGTCRARRADLRAARARRWPPA